MSVGWPVRLAEGPVGLRPPRRRDSAAWARVRARNVDWLGPWEATSPPQESGEATIPYAAMLRRWRREARAGTMLPFFVTYEGRFAGQCNVAGITYGAFRSASVGYWLDRAQAGQGVMPTALALAVDHCFTVLRLHRIEVNIRPENRASRRVVEKLGFREEGMRRRMLHIDGAWRDHISYALTTEEVPDGLLRRWRSGHTRSS
ncbi:MAG: GNAT family N-acetyltransferase [Actinomycetes bacterium]